MRTIAEIKKLVVSNDAEARLMDYDAVFGITAEELKVAHDKVRDYISSIPQCTKGTSDYQIAIQLMEEQLGITDYTSEQLLQLLLLIENVTITICNVVIDNVELQEQVKALRDTIKVLRGIPSQESLTGG